MIKKHLENYINLAKKYDENLQFNIADIGAHPYALKEEPYHMFLDHFPGSKVFAFDIDEQECQKLNSNAKEGLKFYPYALGKKNEKRLFYETNHPMCSSLYEPDTDMMKLYNALENAYLKKTYEIETITLDKFIKDEKIEDLDFIKIDIQGGELDVLEGAITVLSKIIAVVSEVEFVQIYKNQPLFGDVNTFLTNQNMMFYKFLGLSGRTMRPTIIKDILYASQHMWSDALFIKKFEEIRKLTSSKLLKLSIIAANYGSPDISFNCFKIFDEINNTNLTKELVKLSS